MRISIFSVVATLQNLASISSDGSIHTFSRDTSALEGLLAEDMMVSDTIAQAPGSFLQKVTSAKHEEVYVTIETNLAPLGTVTGDIR